MRLVADENIPFPAVEALREAGHDVQWMVEEDPGRSDPEILHQAFEDGRILITCDTDFGLLSIKQKVPNAGIVLFRLSSLSLRETVRRIVEAVASRESWSGLFAVVDENRVRTRPLPNA